MPEWIALIRLHTLKGFCHEWQGQLVESKQAYEVGVALAERFGIQYPDIVYFLYGPLGNVYSRLEETTEASLLVERCIEMLRGLFGFGMAARRSIDLGISLQSRGLLAARLGRAGAGAQASLKTRSIPAPGCT